MFGDQGCIERLYSRFIEDNIAVSCSSYASNAKGISSNASDLLSNKNDTFHKDILEQIPSHESIGSVIRCFLELLDAKDQLIKHQNIGVSITAQFLEIYKENVGELNCTYCQLKIFCLKLSICILQSRLLIC